MGLDSEFDRPTDKIVATSRFSWWRVGCLMVAIVLVAIALLLPETRSPREAARRSQCVNNLKQIAFALKNYEQQYGTLPPARTVDAAGRPLHSWRTLILPFMDQENLYRHVDLGRPWDDPANAAVAAAMPTVYGCPFIPEPRGMTHYQAVVGPRTCFPPAGSRRLNEITRDPGETLMIVETARSVAVPWMAPVDADDSWLRDLSTRGNTDHPGGTNAALVDASVRFLKASEPAEARRESATIDAEPSRRPDPVAPAPAAPTPPR